MADIKCPIPGCDHVFIGSIIGWPNHVASLDKHPRWYPKIRDAQERRDLFAHIYPKFFGESRRSVFRVRKDVDDARAVLEARKERQRARRPSSSPPSESIVVASGAPRLAEPTTISIHGPGGPLGVVTQIPRGWVWASYQTAGKSPVAYASAGDAVNAFLLETADVQAG